MNPHVPYLYRMLPDVNLNLISLSNPEDPIRRVRLRNYLGRYVIILLMDPDHPYNRDALRSLRKIGEKFKDMVCVAVTIASKDRALQEVRKFDFESYGPIEFGVSAGELYAHLNLNEATEFPLWLLYDEESALTFDHDEPYMTIDEISHLIRKNDRIKSIVSYHHPIHPGDQADLLVNNPLAKVSMSSTICGPMKDVLPAWECTNQNGYVYLKVRNMTLQEIHLKLYELLGGPYPFVLRSRIDGSDTVSRGVQELSESEQKENDIHFEENSEDFVEVKYGEDYEGDPELEIEMDLKEFLNMSTSLMEESSELEQIQTSINRMFCWDFILPKAQEDSFWRIALNEMKRISMPFWSTIDEKEADGFAIQLSPEFSSFSDSDQDVAYSMDAHHLFLNNCPVDQLARLLTTNFKDLYFINEANTDRRISINMKGDFSTLQNTQSNLALADIYLIARRGVFAEVTFTRIGRPG